MSYKVTLWASNLGESEVKFYMSRAQAIHGMRKFAYAKLEAFGKLDTDAAHKVMSDIGHCDDILPPQDERHVTISNTGYTLTIRNTACAPKVR